MTRRVLAALGLVVLLAGCSGDDGGSTTGEGGVTLRTPDGWVADGSGLEVAEDEGDLGQGDPEGAVIRVEVGADETPDFVGTAEEVFADPTAVEYAAIDDMTVDGREAVGFAVRTEDRVQQYAVVHPEGAESLTFLLDAPANRYEELREVFADAVEISA